MKAPSLLLTFTIVFTLLLGNLQCIQSSIIEEKTMGTPAGWTDDVKLTNNATPDMYPSIAVYEDNVHIVWLNMWAGQKEIYYINSTDGGITWNSRKRLSLGDPVDTDLPEIVVNKSNIHVVWQDSRGIGPYEIIYCNSTDGGTTWSSSKMISEDDGFESAGPLMAVNNSDIHVVWSDTRFGYGQAEVYYKRSMDGGITWDDGQGNPNFDRRITYDLSDAFAAGIGINNSNIHVLFGDNRDGSFDIYYTRSTDNGVTWDDGLGTIDEERKLTINSTEHLSSAIAVDGSTIHVIWVDEVWPGPKYYLYYRNSTDNGVNWNPIQLLAGGINGPNKPDMKVDSNIIHIVWDAAYDDKDIYYINSTDAGGNWSAPLRISVDDAFDSLWPKIDVYNNIIHTAWYDKRDSNWEIYYKRSPDFPLDTDPPIPSNETPPPDSYKDAPGTEVSVHVTDPSSVNESTIQLYVNGSLVFPTLTPITDGYNVSYDSGGFGPGIVTCRIVADDNLGNHLDYTWNFTVLATYVIPLRQGWNLISVPLVQVNTSINEVLKDIDGNWDFIEYYDTESGEWKSYATFWPESLNEFYELNNTMAIWINITEPDVNLTSRGIISTYTEIPLYAGWNFVGYPTQTQETVGNALWGTGADRVEGFDATDPYRLKEVSSTYIMKPGEGYWLHVPADTVWVVDW
jgi:hypothetical protein